MNDAQPVFYPRYCFGLAPTFNTWCLLHATTIHALQQHAGFEGQNIFFHGNIPLQWVRIVGLVVDVSDFWGRRVFTIDDSSGLNIECNVEGKIDDIPDDVKDDKKNEPKAKLMELALQQQLVRLGCDKLEVGAVVDLKGTISRFRDEKVIKILRLKVLRSTAEEVVLWERRTALLRDVLGKPWVLTQEEVKACRRLEEEADREQRRKERKKEKLKKKRESEREEKEADDLDGFGRKKAKLKITPAADAIPRPTRQARGAQSDHQRVEQELDTPVRDVGAKTRNTIESVILNRHRPEEVVAPTIEEDIDGYGRSRGPSASRSQKESGDALQRHQEEGNTSRVKDEVDGFGRKKSATQRSQKAAGRKVCQDKERDPENDHHHGRIDGLGRPRRPSSEAPRSAKDGAESPRIQTTPNHATKDKLDSFGREVGSGSKPLRPARAIEKNESQSLGRNVESRASDELDGFGRKVKPRSQIRKPEAAGRRPRPSQRQHHEPTQQQVHDSGASNGVELDGFGRPRKRKGLHGGR